MLVLNKKSLKMQNYGFKIVQTSQTKASHIKHCNEYMKRNIYRNVECIIHIISTHDFDLFLKFPFYMNKFILRSLELSVNELDATLYSF